MSPCVSWTSSLVRPSIPSLSIPSYRYNTGVQPPIFPANLPFPLCFVCACVTLSLYTSNGGEFSCLPVHRFVPFTSPCSYLHPYSSLPLTFRPIVSVVLTRPLVACTSVYVRIQPVLRPVHSPPRTLLSRSSPPTPHLISICYIHDYTTGYRQRLAIQNPSLHP